jgi:ribonuclease P protein subunit RPR2
MGQHNRRTAKAPNKHLHSRISFLYQAATLLEERRSLLPTPHIGQERSERSDDQGPASSNITTSGLSRRLVSDMTSIAKKGQIHQSRSLKRDVCKHCNALLRLAKRAGYIENMSKGGKKPWSDVFVVECCCGTKARYPIRVPQRERSQLARHVPS